ncbi:MAG: hypothetical protein Q4F44_09415 [Bacteroidales bacterium]|nr:hypothetical protein [Bacteroidales bacterium]
MKRRFLMTLVLAIAGMASMIAQTTALVTYEGGYFIKDGKEWTEYRPADKVEPWNEYKQYNEDDKFFYLESKRCNVSVPKISHDKIYVDRKKNGNWEVVYNTLNVHLLCPEGNALYYTYRNHSMKHYEYDGYFVRDNLNWREYRPRLKSGVWAEFKQTAEDYRYFTLESAHNIVYIPKTTDDDIVIKDKDNRNWSGGYAIQAVYDRSATYLYSFYYTKSGLLKGKNKYGLTENTARISFDNKCNIQISFNGKHYDLTYTGIEVAELNGKEAILITIDKDNRIWLFDGTAQIECKKIGKKMLFVGAGSYRKLMEQLKFGTFRI